MITIGPGVVEWVAAKTNEYGSFNGGQGIGWTKNGTLVAGTVYADWNGVNVVAHIASDGSKTWLTREYLAVIFDYPFRQLKVNRITCMIGSDNHDSRRLCEHLGFELETKLTKAHPSGDLLIYRMFKTQCRYLNRDVYKLPYALEEKCPKIAA